MAAVLGAAALALAAPPALAHPDDALNTWEGSCSSVPGVATWPEEPIRFTPVHTALLADLDGGSCTGTVNGQPVTGVPLLAHFDMRGDQSCVHGIVEGRARLTIAGVDFHGDAIYRRAGITVAMRLRGDAGGAIEALVRGTTGAAGSTDPSPAIEFMADCAGDGHRTVGLIVDHGRTIGTYASPAGAHTDDDQGEDEDGDG